MRTHGKFHELLFAGDELFLAVGADATRQTLRHNRLQGCGEQEALHAKVQETRDTGRRVVGVQRGEHQVTGERCLNGDLRRLQVTHFAHQNDVRILTQEAAQEPGEGQVLIHIHLALNQAFNVIFHRIFGGEDLGLNVIEFVERGVQRSGLAGTGWTSDDDNSVGLVDQRAQLL